jgi:hypothetical protein
VLNTVTNGTACAPMVTRTWQAADCCGNLATCSQTMTIAPAPCGLGELWIPSENNRQWYSVASSADGSKLVAVVYGGQIYTSTDYGISWMPRETSRQWSGVASSADGTKVVALEMAGQIYTSIDSGATWTPRESNRYWRSVASSADGSKLVATVDTGRIYTSTDSGETWTPRQVNRWWSSVASSTDGSKLVAVPYGGWIHISTDSGVSWGTTENYRSWQSVASSADGSRLVAVGLNTMIYTSSDYGLTWVPRENSRLWSSVASSADGSKLIAAVDGGRIYTSTDFGVTWTPHESNRSWKSVALSTDGSRVVAAVIGGQIYTSSCEPGLTLICSSNKTVECGTEWSFDSTIATSGCCLSNITINVLDTVTNMSGCTPAITRIWQATDCCGNTSTCSQTVTVTDGTPPVITVCPTNIVICSTNGCGAMPNVTNLVQATDNSGVVHISQSIPAGNILCSNTIVTLTVTDDCGNQATCNASITVGSAASLITGYALAVDGFHIQFVTQPGFNYAVEYTDSLAPANWQVLANVPGDGNIHEAVDPRPLSATRFFRLHRICP